MKDNPSIQYYRGLIRQLETNLNNAVNRIKNLEETTRVLNQKLALGQDAASTLDAGVVPADLVSVHDHTIPEQGGMINTMGKEGRVYFETLGPASEFSINSGLLELDNVGALGENVLFWEGSNIATREISLLGGLSIGGVGYGRDFNCHVYGNVEIDGNLDVIGNITSPTIDTINARLTALEEA